MSPDRVADEGSRHDSYASAGPMLDHIGPYRVLAMLGEGGMGIVYLAEQSEPVHREVALKVLRAGDHTREIVARFESERQALALMEHPNITRVYDAGATADGLPYFVMERVSGAPITDYAAEHRLTTRQRVRLIVQVCRAVQHAHQKGIIHRDIKPSNVLVMESDGEPVCKIIDFGIAKATAPRPGWAKLTGTGMVIGTPAYMSPEQFDGDGVDIDTRSDIYSIGVLLYELIAGVLPFGTVQSGRRSLSGGQLTGDVPAPSRQYAALEQSKRKALASERRSDPGALRRTMAGDLDCIILKALETDRDQRYATSNALALDLERYLTDEPVAARAATATYRAQKFARRHRAGVAFAATLIVLLAAVAVGASVQARRLAVANATVRARQAQAEELIDFMLGDLRDRLEPIGKLGLLDAVGAKALGYFAAVPAAELSEDEQFRHAQAVQQLGNVRRVQGKLPEAAMLMRQSIALIAPLVARDSQNPKWQLGLAHNHFYAGNVEWERGNVDSALAHFLPLVQVSDRLIAQYPDSLSYRAEVAYALNNIGFAREAKGDASAGLASYQAALAIMTPLVRRDTANTSWRSTLASFHNASGVARRKVGDLAGALRDHQEELAIKEALTKRDTANREWQRSVAVAHFYLSDIRLWTGDANNALSEARAARDILTSLVAHDSTNVAWRIGLAAAYRRMGVALLEGNNAPGAVRALDTASATLGRLPPSVAANTAFQREGTAIGAARARALFQSGRASEALPRIEQVIAAGEAAIAKTPGDLTQRKLVADSYLVLGEVLNRPGDASGATTAWARALVMVDSLARAAKETDVLALQATAMLRLRGNSEARPVVDELLRRGYRRPSFVALTRASGVNPM
jgi:tetratricopeptide (TPR) repeat protein/predicted Ser/Thr protein kinase